MYKVRVDPGFYMPRVVKRATSRAVAHAALQVGAAVAPLPRTNRTRLVPPPVLIGHVSSLPAVAPLEAI